MTDAEQIIQEKIDEFLSERRQAVFATNRQDGPPQLSPVWFLWEDGVLYVSTSAQSYKARNISADPNVSACVDGGWGDYRYVAMSGEVSVAPYKSDLQQDMRWRIIRKYHDSDESARAYFDQSADEETIIIILKPSRVIYHGMN